MRAAGKEAEKIRASYRKGDLTEQERSERIVKLWMDARDRNPKTVRFANYLAAYRPLKSASWPDRPNRLASICSNSAACCARSSPPVST